MKPKNHSRKKDVLFILISSFVVVVAWIGFNLHHIWITSTISDKLQLQLTPIDGTFDMETLQKLKSREQVNPEYDRVAVPSQEVPTPTVSLELSPTSVPTP